MKKSGFNKKIFLSLIIFCVLVVLVFGVVVKAELVVPDDNWDKNAWENQDWNKINWQLVTSSNIDKIMQLSALSLETKLTSLSPSIASDVYREIIRYNYNNLENINKFLNSINSDKKAVVFKQIIQEKIHPIGSKDGVSMGEFINELMKSSNSKELETLRLNIFSAWSKLDSETKNSFAKGLSEDSLNKLIVGDDFSTDNMQKIRNEMFKLKYGLSSVNLGALVLKYDESLKMIVTERGTPIKYYGDGKTGLDSIKLESLDNKDYIVYKNKAYGKSEKGSEVWIQESDGYETGHVNKAFFVDSKKSYDLHFISGDKEYNLGDVSRGSGKFYLDYSAQTGPVLKPSSGATYVNINFETSNGNYAFIPDSITDDSKSSIRFAFDKETGIATPIYKNLAVYGGSADNNGDIKVSYSAVITGNAELPIKSITMQDIETINKNYVPGIYVLSDGDQKGAMIVNPGEAKVETWDFDGQIEKNGFTVYANDEKLKENVLLHGKNQELTFSFEKINENVEVLIPRAGVLEVPIKTKSEEDNLRVTQTPSPEAGAIANEKNNADLETVKSLAEYLRSAPVLTADSINENYKQIGSSNLFQLEGSNYAIDPKTKEIYDVSSSKFIKILDSDGKPIYVDNINPVVEVLNKQNEASLKSDSLVVKIPKATQNPAIDTGVVEIPLSDLTNPSSKKSNDETTNKVPDDPRINEFNKVYSSFYPELQKQYNIRAEIMDYSEDGSDKRLTTRWTKDGYDYARDEDSHTVWYFDKNEKSWKSLGSSSNIPVMAGESSTNCQTGGNSCFPILRRIFGR